jgi:ribosomal protein S18 acetylase RimI-like enzyme
MVGFARVTRNRYTREAYERLKRAGVTATLMTEYERTLRSSPDVPYLEGVRVREACPDSVRQTDAPTDELRPEEAVIGAFENGQPVGYLFCSLDSTHDIEPLERTYEFSGAYIRRVYVSAAHRQRGIATALLGWACRWAFERDAETATALVARDNSPSRALFTHHGFRPVRDHRYVRLGRFSHRSTQTRCEGIT